jgi:diguanylate cyclase (GGDEF)-like protein
MLVADLDHFKKINDVYGHYAGDEFIKRFANILERHSGPEGTCFRVGGEEFCIVFSKTDINSCYQIAENIRLATQEISLGSRSDFIPVTTSIGIVSCNKQLCDMSELLKRADRKLYLAKQHGRNQVVK